MKSLSIASLVLFAASLAQAAAFKSISCWKGFNQKDQDGNLVTCRQQAANDQKCSTNLWETGQGAYDVCLMAPNGPLAVISTFKGYNQKDQDANLKKCRQQEDRYTICITNLWVHKQGAYDVCLMRPRQ